MVRQGLPTRISDTPLVTLSELRLTTSTPCPCFGLASAFSSFGMLVGTYAPAVVEGERSGRPLFVCDVPGCGTTWYAFAHWAKVPDAA